MWKTLKNGFEVAQVPLRQSQKFPKPVIEDLYLGRMELIVAGM